MTKRNDDYALVHRSVVVGLADCPHCLVLYAWLDVETGEHPTWDRSASAASKALGWQPRTVIKHVAHLAERGLIEVDRRGQQASPRFRLRHQPGRRLYAKSVDLPTPSVPTRPSRTYGRQAVEPVTPDDPRTTRVVAVAVADDARTARVVAAGPAAVRPGTETTDDARTARVALGSSRGSEAASPPAAAARGARRPRTPGVSPPDGGPTSHVGERELRSAAADPFPGRVVDPPAVGAPLVVAGTPDPLAAGLDLADESRASLSIDPTATGVTPAPDLPEPAAPAGKAESPRPGLFTTGAAEGNPYAVAVAR